MSPARSLQPRKEQAPGRTQGTTMIENLVALVVLSIGLLGHAGLQNFGLKNNTQSYWRTQASLLTTDIVDRMRANPAGIAVGAYDKIELLPDDPKCVSTFCSPEDMARSDAYAWLTTLARELPQGRGTVTRTTASPLFTVTITWQERDVDVATDKAFSMVFLP